MKEPYTVKPWRHVFDEEEKEINGLKWHWCKGDHYSGGVTHDGMYTTHKTDGHDKWRKEQDEKNAQKYEAQKLKRAGSPPVAGAKPETKKLALSDKLHTALTTKAGLSNEM